ncbi:MAG: 30S ribosomal protein S16 [Acidobacteriota bacterium]
MLRIRMSRMGGKKDPHYRVVVAERRGPRDGRFVESVGYYNPALNPIRLNLDLERVDYWIGMGAQPSETVRSLIRKVRTQAETPAEAPAEVLETAAEEKVEEAVVVEGDAPEVG